MLSIIVISDSKSKELLATLESIAYCLKFKTNDSKLIEIVVWVYDRINSYSEVNDNISQSNYLKGYLKKKIDCKSKIFVGNDSGIYDAQYKAAKAAEFPNLIFINSGDFLDPEFRLDNYKHAILKYDFHWLHGGHKIITKTKTISKRISFTPPQLAFCHQSIIFRKDIFLKCANNRNFKSAGDLQLVLNCLDLVGKPQEIAKPLSIRDKRYEGEGSSMTNALEAFGIIYRRYGIISSIPWIVPILKAFIKRFIWIKK